MAHRWVGIGTVPKTVLTNVDEGFDTPPPNQFITETILSQNQWRNEMSMKAVYVLTKTVGKSVVNQSIYQEAFTERSDAVRSMTNFRNIQNPQLKDESVRDTISGVYGNVYVRTTDGWKETGEQYRAVIEQCSVDEYDLQDYEQDFMVELELKQVYNFTVKVKAADEDLAQALAIENAIDGKYCDEYNSNYPDDAECDVVYCEEA